MVTRKIVVRGLVQGIGFRPFVAETAEQLHITGWVKNTDGIVTILATGEEVVIASFVERLSACAPDGAQITDIRTAVCETESFAHFSIVESEKSEAGNGRRQHVAETGRQRAAETEQGAVNSSTFPLLPADLPTCVRCEAELHDKKNRRYRHPFISCTACGPRYSILNEIPYDREYISMSIFAMCPECEKEYAEKGNVRRHAQTIACKDCGPTLTYKKGLPSEVQEPEAGLRQENIKSRQTRKNRQPEKEALVCLKNAQALAAAIAHIKGGGILAVKDIGGYHLAASPFDADAVRELRRLKGREEKPFAVLFPDTDTVREYCRVDEKEEALLMSAPRPIVLLKKRNDGKKLHEGVCKSSPDIGAMLPCNPVQILLAEEVGPLIMTSANVTGELITTENEMMEKWLAETSVAVLSHDRPIVTPIDDSIVRVVKGKTQTLRRARGMVPSPLPVPFSEEVFAAGGDLKACFCHTGGGRAYLSQHLGDLIEESCFLEYEKQKERMRQLFGFAPEIFAADLHPHYRSASAAGACGAKTAECGKNSETGNEEETKRICKVQHHKAHVASVMAEHDIKGDVLGFAFDGTGYGEDGCVWGSEVFVCRQQDAAAGQNGDRWQDTGGGQFFKLRMERVAHLAPVTLIGGDEGVRNADTILYGYLTNLFACADTAISTDATISTENTIGTENIESAENTISTENTESAENLSKAEEAERAQQSDAAQQMALKKNILSLLEKQNPENKERFMLVERAIRCSINCVQSTSMGRLFDAVSAFLDVCHYNSYEGQAPIELENLAAATMTCHPLKIAVKREAESGKLLMDASGLFAQMAKALQNGVSTAELARGFLYAAADAILAIAKTVEKEQHISQVALSGGTFLNRILLERVTELLEENGFAVYRNELVPPGDGGICLGQAYLAARAEQEKRGSVQSGTGMANV